VAADGASGGASPAASGCSRLPSVSRTTVAPSSRMPYDGGCTCRGHGGVLRAVVVGAAPAHVVQLFETRLWEGR
jgi:hypothetical protein